MSLASDNTLEKLISGLDLTIVKFEPFLNEAKTIKDNLTFFQGRPDVSSSGITFIEAYIDLVFGIQCVQYDISVALKRMMRCVNHYVKRFYMQYMNFCFVEASDLFVDVKENKYGLLNRFQNALSQLNPSYDTSEIQAIINCIIEFKSKYGDKSLRDVFRHYDDPATMYKTKMGFNSEELSADAAATLIDILLRILKICTQFSSVPLKNENQVHSFSGNRTLIMRLMNAAIFDAISGKHSLDTVTLTISKATDSVDTLYRNHIMLQNISNLCGGNHSCEQLIEDADAIIKMQMMTQFLQLDLGCAMQGYLLSETDYERSHSLMFMRVTKQAALTHLFGYNEKKRENSSWARVSRIAGELGLNAELEQLRKQFSTLTSNLKGDSSTSNLYSHYRYGGDLNIYDRFFSVSNSNHIVEFGESKALLNLCSSICDFLKNVLNQMKNSLESRNAARITNFLSILNDLASHIRQSDTTQETKQELLNGIESIRSKLSSCINQQM